MNLRSAALAAFLLLGACSAQASCPYDDSARLTTTPIRRDGPYNKHLAEKLAAIEAGARKPADVILLGDSILARWPASSSQRAFGTEKVLNAGLGGDKTQNLLWRMQNIDWSAQKPRQVFILIGTNNSGGKFPTCDVYVGVRRVAQEAKSMWPRADVAVVSLLPRGENMAENATLIQTVNRELAQNQRAGGYRFINVHDAFLCGRKTPCKLYRGRGQVHLSPEGFELLGKLLRENSPPLASAKAG